MDTAVLQEVNTDERPTLVLFRLALPISLGRLLNVAGTFLVMMMVAQQGQEQLAAGSLAVSSYIMVLTLVSSLFYAIGIRIRYQSQTSSPEQIGILVKQALFLAVALAVPAALSLLYMDNVLLAFHQQPQLVALTRGYFFFSALGLFPLLLLTVIMQFYLGTGKAHMALWLEVVSLPLTLLAAYGLVPGHFGLPPWGLAGAALANFIVQLILLAGMMYIFLRQNNSLYRLTNTPFILSWPICRDLLKQGLPIGLQFGGELAVMAVSTYLMGYFGVSALAALQITSQYALVIFMLNFGLSQALALKISEEQKKPNNAAAAMLIAALQLLGMYMLPVVLVFCTCSYALTCLFADAQPPPFYALTQAFFWLSAIFLLIDGLRNLLSSALRGFHDAHTSSRINLLCLWGISLPVSAIAAFSLQGGPIALRIGFLSGFLVAVVLLSRALVKKFQCITPLKSVNLQEGGYHA